MLLHTGELDSKEEDHYNYRMPTMKEDFSITLSMMCIMNLKWKNYSMLTLQLTNGMVFCDAAHANDLRNRHSTTVVVFTFMGGAIIYKSKTQSFTAGSSTEAEFIATHSAGKVACYLHFLLKDDASHF